MRCWEKSDICKEKKCKVCVLDDCKNTLEILEKARKKEEIAKIKVVKKQLPDCCKNCDFLEILDINKQRVYCPYLVKRECLIGSLKVKNET